MNSDTSSHDLLQQARQLIKSRCFADAIQLLQNLQEDETIAEDAIFLLGIACFAAKDYPAAVQAFEQMTQRFPMNAAGWVNLGATLNRQEDFRRAAEVLRRAVQRDRRCADAWYNLGFAQRGLKMTTMAISAYKEALKLNPRMADAHLNLGRIYAEAGNHSLAQKAFLEVLKIEPDSRKAQSLLENVQAAMKAARKSESPFGRLVDTRELEQRQDNSAPRVLSVTQRHQERDLVQVVTKKIREDARDLVPLLDQALHTHLHRLERLVLDPQSRMTSENPLTLLSATIEELTGKMRVVSNGIDELRNPH